MERAGPATISDGLSQLLYWPVATTSLRTTGNATITEIIPLTRTNATRTAVVDGITITSPTIYISFQTAWAVDDCSSPVGKNHTGSLIALRPDQVSSIHGNSGPQFITQTTSSIHFYGTWQAAPFNYTNLALTPVPLSVYLDQPSCWDEFCPTVYTDYRPVLSVPTEVRSLDPAWKSCDLFWEGIYDPPKALQPTNEAAGPSTPAGYTTSTAAAPSPSPTSPTASPTALPETISTSTSTAAQFPSPTRSTAAVDSPAPANPATPSDTPAGDSTTPQQVSVVDSSSPPAQGPSSDDTSEQPSQSTAQGTTSTQPAAPTVVQESPVEATPTAPVGAGSANTDGPQSSSTGVDVNPTAPAQPVSTAPVSSSPDDAATQPAPSNAIEALTRSSEDPTTVSAAPTTVFTGDDGREHTAVQSSGNVVVDSTVTLSEGGASSVVGEGGVSAVSTALGISQGEGATTVVYGGTSLDPGSVAGASTVPDPAAVFTAGSQTYTATQAASGGVVFGNDETTVTLSQGATTQLGSLAVSVGASGNAVVGTSTLVYTTAIPVGSQGAVFTASGQPLTVVQVSGSLPAVIADAGTTVTVLPGAGATVDGQTVSFDTAGSIVVGSETVALSALPSTPSEAPALVTVGGSTYRVSSGSIAVIAESTLSVGGPQATVEGQTISLASEGIVVASSGTAETIVYADPPASPSALVEVEAAVTLSSRTLTVYQVASSTGIVQFDGTRLFVGGPDATADGQTISAASNGILEDGTLVSWSTTTVPATASDVSKLQASSLGPWSSASDPATTAASSAPSSGQQSPSSAATSAGRSIASGVALMALCVLIGITSVILLS
ncbi:hypothetical protein LTR53_015569 [Teratosphaeriaceae sp. CCFEE 6253]|nr:hypothetical protein LTR53_015569 [Teratosphaeriaceae sp. CCFEE 6253]